jgi:hypothetical protein
LPGGGGGFTLGGGASQLKLRVKILEWMLLIVRQHCRGASQHSSSAAAARLKPAAHGECGEGWGGQDREGETEWGGGQEESSESARLSASRERDAHTGPRPEAAAEREKTPATEAATAAEREKTDAGGCVRTQPSAAGQAEADAAAAAAEAWVMHVYYGEQLVGSVIGMTL